MTFAQRRNRLTTHFSERIPIFKRRVTVKAQQDEFVKQLAMYLARLISRD